MKNKFLNITIIFILPLLLAFTWTSPASAQGPEGDQIVFGDNLILKDGEKIEGDVVVFGGSVTMPASSEIEGDLVVFGGNANIDGKISGDIGMIGGNINLSKTAVVEGDIGLLGGEANLTEGAVVEGDIQHLQRFGFGDDEGFSIPPMPSAAPGAPVPPIPPVPPVVPDAPVPPAPPVEPHQERYERSTFSTWSDGVFDFIRGVVQDIAILIALVVMSWLVAAFMPEQMKTVGDTLTRSAPLSFGVGLSTVFVMPIVSLVFLITICLAFVPLLGFILLGIATLFGWIVAGQIIGERLLIAGERPYSNLVGSTVLGVTALTVVAMMPIIGWIPCIGFIFGLVGGLLGIIVALTGLGAVILTRFGTQPYPPSPAYVFAGGGGSPTPKPAPGPGGDWSSSDILSSLERSEAELRAKIKAALAEADAAEAASPPDEQAGEETPDEPAPVEDPTDEKPARRPRQPKNS